VKLGALRVGQRLADPREGDGPDSMRRASLRKF